MTFNLNFQTLSAILERQDNGRKDRRTPPHCGCRRRPAVNAQRFIERLPPDRRSRNMLEYHAPLAAVHPQQRCYNSDATPVCQSTSTAQSIRGAANSSVVQVPATPSTLPRYRSRRVPTTYSANESPCRWHRRNALYPILSDLRSVVRITEQRIFGVR